MAISNKLVQGDNTQTLHVKYMAGEQEIYLSPGIVKKYLVSGDANRVTDEEIALFIKLCQYQHLNPFLREAHCIKYGNSPATLVVGKDVHIKRARRNPTYKGHQAGVVVLKKDGDLENRIGSLVLNGEDLVGGWAKVFINEDDVPTEITVSFNEYVGLKSDGTVNAQWQKKPGTMIRKVAQAQALREAFPEDLEGLYSVEEMGADDSILPTEPIAQPPELPQAYQDGEQPIVSDEPLPFDGPDIDPLEE